MSTKSTLKVALVGAGNISREYLNNLTASESITVVAVTDLAPKAAAARAEEFGIDVHGSPELALEHPEVELVINLTIPSVHAEVSAKALQAGKHVWSEKPVALTHASGEMLRDVLKNSEGPLGCAPDTFLGPGLQAALEQLRSGVIGQPLFARAVMRYPGPENWHPNPAFLYAPGAGPLFDMGPYYLTFLVDALGPVASVAAVGTTPRPTRTVATGPIAGIEFEVHVPTTTYVLLTFESGATANLTLSFDAPAKEPIQFEIVGSEGSLQLPDPNNFSGSSTLRIKGQEEPTVIDPGPESTTRGTGIIEMADAIANGRPHLASAELALHVLDVLLSASESMESGNVVKVSSTI